MNKWLRHWEFFVIYYVIIIANLYQKKEGKVTRYVLFYILASDISLRQ
jgi:hypothetical protein